MSSQTSPAPTQVRSRRLSKFIEGSPATGAELLQQTLTSNELFLNILSEMDEFERKKRQHRGSSSSVDSLVSSDGSLVKERATEREGRRSLGFGRPNFGAVGEIIEEKKNHKIVGRLKEKRAPYPGT